MKILITIAFFTVGCAELASDDDNLDPELGVHEFALSTIWTPYTSEEDPPIACPTGALVGGARCTGRYCDNIALRCVLEAAPWSDGPFSRPFISDEAPTTSYCDRGEWMIGARCRGRYCDEMSMQCERIDAPPFHSGDGYNCEWTRWFSEELAGGFSWTAGKYARGMQCRGSYCDDVRFYVCNP